MTFDDLRQARQQLKEHRISQSQFFDLLKGGGNLPPPSRPRTEDNPQPVTNCNETPEYLRLKQMAIDSGLYYPGMKFQ